MILFQAMVRRRDVIRQLRYAKEAMQSYRATARLPLAKKNQKVIQGSDQDCSVATGQMGETIFDDAGGAPA
jgi:hypothetical protein